MQEFTYDSHNTLTHVRVNGQEVRSSTFDINFNPTSITDANNHTTLSTYARNGLLLAQTDALGRKTSLTYDSSNHLTSLTDPLGGTSHLTYDTYGNPLSITVAGPAPSTLQATTLYTYTYNAAYGSRLVDQRSQDGVVTHFEYASQQPLQVIRRTTGYGTALAQVSEYGYDALGRVITTTVGVGTALARSDTTSYNADNTLAKTIRNYQNGVFDPAHPDQDVITTYGYDDIGRLVWVRDPLGRYNVTHYNSHDQLDWTTNNLTPLQLDSAGQPIFQSYSTSAPDANVATLYGYDGLGRTILVTQTGILTGTFDPATLRFSQATTRVTRTEYDAQSRPVTTTLNYRPGLPASADTNVRLVTSYDAVGNVTWQRDALGSTSKTEYDALDRAIKIIGNYENGNPATVDAINLSWTNGSDTDLTTVIQYSHCR